MNSLDTVLIAEIDDVLELLRLRVLRFRHQLKIAEARVSRWNQLVQEFWQAGLMPQTAILGRRLVEDAGKRMIRASDGFDSDQPHSKQMLAMFSMLHAWFVEQIRKKVLRGMRDAFEKGKNIRPPAVGYNLVPKLDADGRTLVNAKERIVKEKVIDEATAPFVEEAFRALLPRKSPKPTRRLCCKTSTVSSTKTWPWRHRSSPN